MTTLSSNAASNKPEKPADSHAGKPATLESGEGPTAHEAFRRFASWTSVAAGSPWTFIGATAFLLLWVCSYPLFLKFHDPFNTWQLVINTVTTIVTFLMVFLIQNTQNRDAKALHLKLDELIRAMSGARNSLVELENCTDEEIEELKREFERIHRKAASKNKAASDSEIARLEIEQQKRTTDA